MRSLGAYAIDRRPLAVPAFRRLWLGSLVCAVGGSFAVVAVPVQLFTMTGSSATVGASAVVAFVALAVAALGAGAVADARDRRWVLLVTQSGLAAAYLGLWAQAALGGRWLPVVFVLVACQAFAFGAASTTMGAVVPRLVPTELLPAASSLNSLTRYAGSIIGPVLAGVLIPLVGLATLYLFDAVALTAVLWAVARLPRLAPPARDPRRPAGVRAGFRHLAASRLLRTVLALDLAAMAFGMPVALFPELAERTYGGPAGGGPQLGLLYAAYPAGVLLAGLCSGTFTRAGRHGLLLAGATVGWGATVVLLGLAGRLWLALVALVLGGAANFVLSTFRNAITQAHTDDALRGRTQGALTVVLLGGPQLANLLHGSAGALVGPRVAICAGGLLTVLSAVVLLRRTPELRDIGRRTAADPALRT